LHYTRGFGYYEEYKQDQNLDEYGLTPFELNQELIETSDLVRQEYLDNYFGGMIFSLDYSKNKLNLSLGGGGNYYDGNHYGDVIWVKNYAGDPSFVPSQEYYRSKGKKSDVNIYLKGNYSLTKNLNIYGDLQIRRIDYAIKGKNDVWDWVAGGMQDLNVHDIFNFFNPKAGLYYRLNPKSVLYSSVAVANREPNWDNYTDAGTNEIPRPERLTDYELGYQFNTGNWAFSANLYNMVYKDQLVLNGKINAIGEALTSNVPESYRTGIELTARVRIVPCLEWNGNLTLSQNKIKNYTEYVPVYDSDGNAESVQQADYYGTTNIAFSPDVIANSLFTFKYKSFTAGFHSNYVGKQYLDNTGQTDANDTDTRKKERNIGAYFVNNLRLSYDFGKHVSVNLSINNLFNEQYEMNGWVWSCYYRQPDGSLEPYTEKSYFPQAGINLLANVALRF